MAKVHKSINCKNGQVATASLNATKRHVNSNLKLNLYISQSNPKETLSYYLKVKEATRISHGLSKNFLGIFKETTLAYFFDIFGLLAGFLIAYQLDVFTRTPWALALYPTLISIRIISGLLSGRLSTALHLGTIYPRFFGNTKTFYKLIDAIIVLTLVTSLTVSVISLLFGYLFWGITHS